MSERAITPFKSIFPDWKILQGLFILKKKLIKNNFSIVPLFFYVFNFFYSIINYSCSFFYSFYSLNNYIKRYISVNSVNLNFLNFFFINNNVNIIINSLFTKSIVNYYSSDVFCKNSKVMSICSSKINNSVYL